ncbi:MAG: multidrug efflux SMR transporter [Sandaracinaceae bacterium]
MAWIYLIAGGLLEVGWSVGLRYTEGFTKPIPTALTFGAIGLSTWMLALSTKTVSVGTAYAVWVAIGVVGAVVLGAVLYREPVSLIRGICLAGLIASIVGLKLTMPAGAE